MTPEEVKHLERGDKFRFRGKCWTVLFGVRRIWDLMAISEVGMNREFPFTDYEGMEKEGGE